MSLKQIASVVLLFVVLLACSGPTGTESSGTEFVGKWQQIHGKNTIEFVKDGDSFLLLDTGSKYTAVAGKDGTLRVGEVVYSYSKGSDTIIALGDEFKRIK